MQKSTLKRRHPKACKVELFPLYTFRHTCLTRWAAFMDPYTLAYLAGHSDFSTTRRYVHLRCTRFGKQQNAREGHRVDTVLGTMTGKRLKSKPVSRRISMKTGRIVGRGERIRTSGLLDPNQAL